MKKKALLLVLAAALIVVASIGGTLAWLSDKTTAITNTFTAGDVGITLTEPNYDGNDSAILVPGVSIDKDPTVTVTADSEDCYVFVKVTNELSDILSGFAINSDWEAVGGHSGLYQYKEIVQKSSTDTVLTKLFTSITVDQDADADTVATYDGKTIVVTAYAIQSDIISEADAITQAATALGA